MVTLIDGPAAGSYLLKRSPLFVRAVVDVEGRGDVLDQLGDTPAADEALSVYRLEGEMGLIHLNMGGGRGGFYARASYRHLPDVDGESVRETDAWREWVEGQVDGEIDVTTGGMAT